MIRREPFTLVRDVYASIERGTEKSVRADRTAVPFSVLFRRENRDSLPNNSVRATPFSAHRTRDRGPFPSLRNPFLSRRKPRVRPINTPQELKNGGGPEQPRATIGKKYLPAVTRARFRVSAFVSRSHTHAHLHDNRPSVVSRFRASRVRHTRVCATR